MAFQLESRGLSFGLHPGLKFWTQLVVNGHHADQFGRFGHFYGRKNGYLGGKGNPDYTDTLPKCLFPPDCL